LFGYITGLSFGFHDAAATRIDTSGNIYLAVHSERYTGKKNDRNLHPEYITLGKTVFYEKPFRKNLRRLYAGQRWKSRPKADYYIDHHWSHAAASYYTRPWEEEPVCVVIDAIGEWDTASIWWKKKKVWSMKYPQSLGLFYSAMTHYIGLKPNEDEHIMMGMAAFGNAFINMDYIFSQNLHRGCKHIAIGAHEHNIAASAQRKLEEEIKKIMTRAKKYSNYLCYGGGVALNCVANTKIHNMFDKIWIFPNPGDAGSSLGAAAAYLDKPLQFKHPYLGHHIRGEINVKEVVTHLLDHSYCGIANGGAEFGPRALGNRSLIADPRRDVKDTVNKIKRRQLFRPFAPAILEEYADEYFDGPMNEYMQYVAKAKHDYKSVTHVDGTARVQIVKPNCESVIRKILEEWYEQTKCPMLLNTSLNIKGKPMVNDAEDALLFEKKYGVKVF
jgi:carbamoyltransferase